MILYEGSIWSVKLVEKRAAADKAKAAARRRRQPGGVTCRVRKPPTILPSVGTTVSVVTPRARESAVRVGDVAPSIAAHCFARDPAPSRARANDAGLERCYNARIDSSRLTVFAMHDIRWIREHTDEFDRGAGAARACGREARAS